MCRLRSACCSIPQVNTPNLLPSIHPHCKGHFVKNEISRCCYENSLQKQSHSSIIFWSFRQISHRSGRQPIIWPNFPRKLHENESNLTECGGISGTPLGSANRMSARASFSFCKTRSHAHPWCISLSSLYRLLRILKLSLSASYFWHWSGAQTGSSVFGSSSTYTRLCMQLRFHWRERCYLKLFSIGLLYKIFHELPIWPGLSKRQLNSFVRLSNTRISRRFILYSPNFNRSK